MEGVQVAPRSSESKRTRYLSLGARLIRRHPVELAFTVFTIVFCALLQFVDPANLIGFFEPAADFTIGRNPYGIYLVLAPPGLFLPMLPTFAIYVLSGYNFAIANFSLKIIQLGALLALVLVFGRVASLLGIARTSVARLRWVILLSPVLFFVTFIWGEQDVVGIAIATLGLLLVLQGSRSATPLWEECAGVGLIVFGAFTYYFPICLLPTLFAYSRDRFELARRLGSAAIAIVGFGLWFLVHPGWNFVPRLMGTAQTPTASVFSPISLLGPGLAGPFTSVQSQWYVLAVLLFIGLELFLPLLFRWSRVSWTVSMAVAITLPFLLINILNGDEFVWPLPFLLLALASSPVVPRGNLRWWCVQLYAAPMLLLANLYDDPGPGAGSGIFYFGYTQFRNAVDLASLVPDSFLVARLAVALLAASLLALLAICVALDRVRLRSESVGPPASRPYTPPPPGPPGEIRVASDGAKRNIPPENRWGFRQPSRWVAAGVVTAVALTALSAAFPAPVLTGTSSDQFPLGLFHEYPVSNSSVTYSLSPGSSLVTIAPNFGNASALLAPWRWVGFTQNVTGDRLSMNLSVDVAAPAGFPYNISVLAYGSTALNVVVPFVLPPLSARLPLVQSQNLSEAPAVISPQFTGTLTGAAAYQGSSYASYHAIPLERPGGQVTLLFRWSGVQLLQNVVMALYRGNVSYELFGVGGVYTAGLKSTLNGTWSYSAPRLVTNESWHELTFTNSSNGTQIALDGMPIDLPPVPRSSEGQSAFLFVGSVNASSTLFQRYDFWGTFAGPYDTTGNPVALGGPLWCPGTLGNGSQPGGECTPFSSSFLSVRTSGGGTASATTPFTTYWLNSTTPELTFGRISDVGPTLTILLRSFSITTNHSLLPLVWFVDGAIAAPVLLVLLARPERGRSTRPRAA